MKLRFVIDKKYDESFVKDSKLIAYIEEQYETSLDFLERTKNLYQLSWDEINDSFSEYVEKETQHAWLYPEYECVVSVVHRGISNWGTSQRIVRGWQENPYLMRRITAHELILSHYWGIYKKEYEGENLKDGQVWALAEIAAFALTALPAEVKKFWPWDTTYYTNHNYPHIVDMQNKLKDAFLGRKDFDDYMKTGITLVKAYPDMGPTGPLEKRIKVPG